jgi:hypothetical protein
MKALSIAARAFAAALRVAIASGEFSDADTLHMKRLLGNVDRIANA